MVVLFGEKGKCNMQDVFCFSSTPFLGGTPKVKDPSMRGQGTVIMNHTERRGWHWLLHNLC